MEQEAFLQGAPVGPGHQPQPDGERKVVLPLWRKNGARAQISIPLDAMIGA
jgi:hypothetical protein